ncbi:glycosyl transferase [Leuconostoc citreum]|uniref:Glycosyl transferase n=1 Tax=Leuconostoc citreum TaxID=33964 RepID=A0A5A5U058_LEUCI|nr:glycosyltransferase [Leuconostoc citreum]GDZ83285.1 glycosyl transferase [Leuconostoc citreum]
MSFNTVFVVTEMRLGGRERVVSNIAGALNEYTEVAIFSVWRRMPFFISKAPLYFDKNSFVQTKSHAVSQKLENKKWMKLIILIVKKLVPYTILRRKRLDDLVDFLQQNNVKNVVLTDLTSTFAYQIRKRLPDINIISWIHMQSDAFFDIQYKEYNKELKRGLSSVNSLVALTPSQQSEYKKYVSRTLFIPNPMPAVSKHLADMTKKTILIIARIDIQHKGLDYLKNLVTYVPNEWKIKVVGSGSPEDEKIFEDIVDSSNNKIIWESAMDDDRLEKVYQEASIFIMPSRFEGFPLTLGEAMSHGLPIIAFDLDGTRIILKDGNNNYGILIPKENVQIFGETIVKLTNNENLRKQLATESIRRVNSFSEEKIIDKWIKILNQ